MLKYFSLILTNLNIFKMIRTIKSLILIAVAILSVNIATAQDYKPVEVDFGVRYNVLTGDFSGGGVGFFLEPHYNVNDKIAIGLRLGFDLLGGTIEGTETAADISLLSSYILTGDYYLVNSGNKRVFAGLGVGLSGQGSVSFEDDPTGTEVEIGNVFGVVPRVGVKLGILKLAVDYSIYPKDGAKSFLGFNLGLSFGGKAR